MRIRADRMLWFFLSVVLVFAIQVPCKAQAGYLYNQMGGSTKTLTAQASTFYGIAIAQGDFNADGRLDLVVMNQEMPDCGWGSQSTCSVAEIYLAQTNGSYKLAASYGVPGIPCSQGYSNSITVGDVNGDGKPDLVYSDQLNSSCAPNDIVVQLGNGDGTFQIPIITTTVATNAASVIFGDFNADGKPDVAYVDTAGNNAPVGIYVHLGNGDGTLQAPTFYAVSNCSPSQVITADFNRDNKPDLAISCYYGGQSGTQVLLNNGDGTFGNPTVYSVGAAGVAAADINGDGILDLIVTGYPKVNSNVDAVNVLLGKGDGTFGTPISTPMPLASNISGNIAVADFNGDGKLDVATAGGWTGVTVFLGNGTGKFPATATYGTIQLGEYSNVLAGDYNQDGKPDLVSVGYIFTGEAFSILANNGDGTFVSGKDYPAGTYPQAVVAGDFNGDGKLDLAITTMNQNVPSIGLYGGTGAGTFAAPKFYPVGSANSNPIGMVTGDFNRDGRLDLAVADNNDNVVSILLGVGNGTFTQTTYPTGLSPQTIVTADLNNDGNLDLVIGDGGDTNITVLLGQGDGTFGAPITWSTGVGQQLPYITVADFNGDGLPDIATDVGGLVEVGLGNGDGTFQPPVVVQTVFDSNPYGIAAADLRGNGMQDLIVSGTSGFYVYPGNGDGTFGIGIWNYSGLMAPNILVTDINGDGKKDVVFAGYNSAVGVALGNGDDTLQPMQQWQVPIFGANAYANSVALGDFNRDGTLDIATVTMVYSTPAKGYLSVLLSNPVPAFSNSSLNFGAVKVGSTVKLNLTVTDQSLTTLVFKGLSITGTAASDFSQATNCGRGLKGFGTCTVQVAFTPSATGSRTATLNIATSAKGPARTITLSGAGN